MTDTIGALTAATPAAGADPAARQSLGARAWAAPLGLHLAAYVLLLLVLLPLARVGVATPDEGAYSLQARLLADGGWEHVPPLERIDPEGRHYPIIFATEADGRWYPYIRHPLVPVLLGGTMRAAGETAGLVALPLLGAVLAAAAAWLLANELDDRWSRPAFWLVALSPLLFNAYVTWAHTISAALAGLSLVALVRILRRGPTWASTVGLACTLSLHALVRSEGVLWAGALLVVLGATAVARRSALVLATAAVSGVALVVTLLAERRWIARILDGAAPRDLVVRATDTEPGYIAGRVEGIWHSTLEGPHLAPVALLLATLAVVVVVAGRRSRPGPVVAMACAALAVAVVGVWLVEPTGMTKGLVPAAPVLVLGAALALRARPAGSAPLVATSGLFAVAVYATQYADGGAFQWGGRFLSPVLVPLAVLAAAGLDRAVRDQPAAGRRDVVRGFALLAVAGAIAGFGALAANRAGLQPLYASVDASASPVNVTTSEHLPRMMWRQDLPWLVAQEAGVGPLLDDLRRDGVSQVTVVARADAVSAPAARWATVDDHGPLGDTGLRILVLRA